MSASDTGIERLNTADRHTLLLLGANGSGAVPSRLHLQKEMLLLRNLYSELADETDFGPSPLGPHSKIVADGVDRMVALGLVEEGAGKLKLSSDGTKAFDALRRNTDGGRIEKIGEFKKFLNDLTSDEILAFAYFSHIPRSGLEKGSAAYRNLLPKRRALALSMYEKDKISAQKAAQISGECMQDFFETLKTRRG